MTYAEFDKKIYEPLLKQLIAEERIQIEKMSEKERMVMALYQSRCALIEANYKAYVELDEKLDELEKKEGEKYQKPTKKVVLERMAKMYRIDVDKYIETIKKVFN